MEGLYTLQMPSRSPIYPKLPTCSYLFTPGHLYYESMRFIWGYRGAHYLGNWTRKAQFTETLNPIAAASMKCRDLVAEA